MNLQYLPNQCLFFGADGGLKLLDHPSPEVAAQALGLEDPRLLASCRTGLSRRLVYTSSLSEATGRRNDLVSQFCGHDVYGDAVVMPEGY